MTSDEASARLLRALRTERRRFWGEIAAREERFAKRRGYVSEQLSRPDRLTLRTLLEVLEVFELDVPRFFGRVFDLDPDPVELLRELESGRPSAPQRRIEQAVAALAERGRDGDAGAAPGAAAALVASIERCSRYERPRSLRESPKYRHPGFVRAYLERLDDLRYDQPRDAARLAAVVAVDLVPQLPGPRAERLALACTAAGVHGSAQRVLGKYGAAARAIRFALESARRAQLDPTIAPLLQRGAYVLLDHGQYRRALLLLREAGEIYSDHGDRTGIGKTLVDRGILLYLVDDHRRSARAFQRALKNLDAAEPRLRRNRLAAYHGLASAYRALGRLADAEQALQPAAALAQQTDQVAYGKVLWLRATILVDLADFVAAERLFHQARAAMAAVGNHLEEALVCLDLASLLVAQGRHDAACELAKGMAAFLVNFRGNKAHEAALLEFIKAGLRGKIEQAVIECAVERLKTAAHPTRVRLCELG